MLYKHVMIAIAILSARCQPMGAVGGKACKITPRARIGAADVQTLTGRESGQRLAHLEKRHRTGKAGGIQKLVGIGFKPHGLIGIFKCHVLSCRSFSIHPQRLAVSDTSAVREIRFQSVNATR